MLMSVIQQELVLVLSSDYSTPKMHLLQLNGSVLCTKKKFQVVFAITVHDIYIPVVYWREQLFIFMNQGQETKEIENQSRLNQNKPEIKFDL